MGQRIKITSWYLNTSRLVQLFDDKEILRHISRVKDITEIVDAGSGSSFSRELLSQSLESWLHTHKVPSIEELQINQNIKPGNFFVFYKDFYGKGLNSPNKTAEIHSKLADGITELRVKYSPANLLTHSAWTRLSGHTRLFVFAYITDVVKNEISASPYVIGDLHADFFSEDYWNFSSYGEIHLTQINSFSKINDFLKTETKAPDIRILKSIPEEKIKTYFAEIINEGTIPKDWGGEKSDLYSTNVLLDNKRISTAFVFKGPAKFKPMTLAECGKNGDQIERLFSEPADLLVLQHCHSVKTDVRSTMRAFASRINDLRYFSIIDGYDTVRLLMAYNKI